MKKNIILAIMFVCIFMFTIFGIQIYQSKALYTIGIIQHAEGDTLNSATQSFIATLGHMGYIHGENCIIEVNNAQGDGAAEEEIAASFVKKKVDLIVAVGTSTTMTTANAVEDTDIPMVYITTSDPFQDGLATQDGISIGNITGISVQLDKREQISSIRELLPTAKSLGIMYTKDQLDLVESLPEYDQLALEYGLDIINTVIDHESDIEAVASTLLQQVDCIISIDDPRINPQLPMIISMATESSVPVFSFVIEHVKEGAVAAQGMDYYEAGRQAGTIATFIISGERTPSEIPCILMKDLQLCLNDSAIKELGMNISPHLLEKVEVTFETITPIY